MADYTPVFPAGASVSLVAASTITGGDPVEVAAAGQVQKVAAPGTTRYVGVAGHDATAGMRVTVIAAAPVHEGAADGTVNAGDQVTPSATAGRQVKSMAGALAAQDVGATPDQSHINTAVNAAVTAVNANRAQCGVALTGAADGATVRWMQI